MITRRTFVSSIPAMMLSPRSILGSSASQGAEHEMVDLTQFVDPILGTGGLGHCYPGATVPFGAVQLSPDTGTIGYNHCAGYRYEDTHILGFSHTHLSGTGCGDLADALLMPRTNEASVPQGDDKIDAVA